MKKRILLTGGAGFIGSTLAESLLEDGHELVIVDNFDPFYPRAIKEKNVQQIISTPGARFIEANILETNWMEQVNDPIDVIVHLAAKAGVRPSIADPLGYQDANVKGTQNLLEFARRKKISQFVFASSSSVYGVNKNIPWSEDDHVLQPISPYASTKVSGELLGHVYAHLFGVRFLALRFFTVYGPRQRPDLAIHKFSNAIMNGKPIDMFGDGSTRRDYTYVDDIVSGIKGAIGYDRSGYEIVNLGNNKMVSLAEMIAVLEEVFGRKAIILQQPEQPGDVPVTCATVDKARNLFGYEARTSFREGIVKFREWYLQHRG